MIRRAIRPLDRYVLGEFTKIFLTAIVGFPMLVIVIDLTDNLQGYLLRQIPMRNIALSYLYWIPDSVFMIVPAAVLFATVFSVSALTRHSEITAAKASGISFYRLVMPILFAATLACGFDLALGEIAPGASAKRNELLDVGQFTAATRRFNFAFAGEYGRVYKAADLRTDAGEIHSLQIERKGFGPGYPTYLLVADSARYEEGYGWRLRRGELNVIPDAGPNHTITFEEAWDRRFTERPGEMMARPRSPTEMRYAELTRFITALERSGGDANTLRVERALKIAIPVTCIIIALFGAPLATSTQRGGAAFGVGISLLTTVVFLMLVQLTKAIGGKALVPPDVAAWIPSAIFGLVGVVLMGRVRT